MQVLPPPGAPESIKVGNLKLKLRFFCGSEETARKAYGYFDINLGDIGISKRRHPWLMAECVIHEVAHSIYAFFQCRKRDMAEELFCAIVGSGMSMVMIDNPSLFRWLNDLTENPKLLAEWVPEEDMRDPEEKAGTESGEDVKS